MATAPAVPRRPIDRRRQFRRQLNRQECGCGTLMRHFLRSGPVTALPLGMRVTTAQTGLIAASSRNHGVVTGLLGAGRGAVTLAAITVAADQHGRAATRAQVASSRRVHWRSEPMDSGHKRALREILCRQRRPRLRGLRGATSELAWRLGPVSCLRLHRPVSFLLYRRPICRASLARRRLLRNPSAGSPAGSKP